MLATLRHRALAAQPSRSPLRWPARRRSGHSCTEVAALLNERSESTLSEGNAQLLAAHLAACAPCRHLAGQLAQAEAAFRRVAAEAQASSALNGAQDGGQPERPESSWFPPSVDAPVVGLQVQEPPSKRDRSGDPWVPQVFSGALRANPSPGSPPQASDWRTTDSQTVQAPSGRTASRYSAGRWHSKLQRAVVPTALLLVATAIAVMAYVEDPTTGASSVPETQVVARTAPGTTPDPTADKRADQRRLAAKKTRDARLAATRQRAASRRAAQRRAAQATVQSTATSQPLVRRVTNASPVAVAAPRALPVTARPKPSTPARTPTASPKPAPASPPAASADPAPAPPSSKPGREVPVP